MTETTLEQPKALPIHIRETPHPHPCDSPLAPHRWVIVKGEGPIARYLNLDLEWQRCPVTYPTRDEANKVFVAWRLGNA